MLPLVEQLTILTNFGTSTYTQGYQIVYTCGTRVVRAFT